MLEIIGQILCTLLLLKGIGFIVQALSHLAKNPFASLLSLIASVLCFVAAIYFFNIIKDQASGARDAMEQATQNMQDSARSLQQDIEKFERDTGVKVPQ